MEKWDLLRVLEVCITQNWEDLCPCEVFPELDFPSGGCEGDCGRCLLNAIQKEEEKMIKCPHCGSTTVEEYETEYFEDSPNEVTVVRHYFCGGGCGLCYTGTITYKKDGEEELEGI